MSSIAQKLCEEICEEQSVKSIKHDAKRETPSACSNYYKGRPTSSIVVKKKREVKVIPNGTYGSGRVVVNKFKSKETLMRKKFVDTGLNTITTGPLRCDNDCVTMVRKRDDKGSCKCANRKNRQVNAKEIQTIDLKYYPLLDKACAHCVEMVNCGTQPLEKRNSLKNSTVKNKSKVKLVYEVDVQTSNIKKESDRKMRDNIALSDRLKPVHNIMGARRWALSKGPTRGPDF